MCNLRRLFWIERELRGLCDNSERKMQADQQFFKAAYRKRSFRLLRPWFAFWPSSTAGCIASGGNEYLTRSVSVSGGGVVSVVSDDGLGVDGGAAPAARFTRASPIDSSFSSSHLIFPSISRKRGSCASETAPDCASINLICASVAASTRVTSASAWASITATAASAKASGGTSTEDSASVGADVEPLSILRLRRGRRHDEAGVLAEGCVD